ncbi:MAG TPA: cyclic nucleotide-binding domain-containing protein [Candidatus Acidoferrales bacterium]|jgi:CRP/FNR family cyclic AMP-dependent transcriptional regulator|nr:cyclic nucleotide-binding domain-containing protein [Candidatus Acidoferrales bacterium]
MESVGANFYFIWGVDDTPYGPVELSTLIDWIKDERVIPETWVFSRNAAKWQQASDFAELRNNFAVKVIASPLAELSAEKPSQKGFKPGMLRRIKILAELNDAQLSQLAEYLEVQQVSQWTVLFNQGDASDAMYLLMSGELRARTMIGGKETILSTFSPGDFFGDMALFDHGPRSADVLANVDSTLFKLSSSSFNRLTHEMPALATPFLQATARTLAARIRADNKRLARVTQQYTTGSEI